MKSEKLVTVSDGKICPNCSGNIIQVSGKCGPSKKFCSVKCQAAYAKANSDAIYKDRWEWVKASDLKIGDRIGFFGKPSSRDESREAGYIAGIFDGEGSLSFNKDGGSAILSMSQRTGYVLNEVASILDSKGFDYSIAGNSRDDCKQLTIAGGRREIARFMEVFAPERLKIKTGAMFDGTVMRTQRSVDVTEVTGIFAAGTQQVVNLQTSSSTYISSGYLSHNCFWYPILMENGDYYGRKLLKAAYTSYFFSMLIHLFSNRYYERFGEPTPVGRAPFGESVQLQDGSEMTSENYMLMQLQSLRNRSVVVLPSDRGEDVGRSTSRGYWEYDLEYMESQMRGADFERYLQRLDEEISLAIFTPILLMKTADVGSYNLGVGHMQMYLWMLNAINADRKTYIDAYFLSPLVDYNFGTNAPRAKIKFNKLDNTNSQLLQVIIQALIAQGTLGFDLEQLGEMAGLTLNEVKLLTPPTTQPSLDNPTKDPSKEPKGVPIADNPGPGSSVSQNALEIRNAILQRVSGQIENAYRDKRFDSAFHLNIGFRRRMEDALVTSGVADADGRADAMYSRLDLWAQDMAYLGESNLPESKDYVEAFTKLLDHEIERAIK